MEHPKLEMLCYLYNRPTVGQAFAECVTEMIRYMGDDDKAVEQIVALCRRDLRAERAQDTT